MTILESLILGVVEGITEYLPVSSTGHLLLTERLLGIPNATPAEKAASDAFAISIQSGAIIAVLWLYFPRVKAMMRGVLGKDPRGLQLAINILVAFVPAAVLGLAFGSKIKEMFFNLWCVSIAWLAGGVGILAACLANRRVNAERSNARGRTLEQLTWKMALFIGLLQCIAMWPGVSRSLVTMVGGMLVGLTLPAAAEFSFLLGVLTLTAATAKETLDHGGIMLKSFGPTALGIGMLAAFVSAVLAVKWLVAFLQRHGMAPFGYYRIALGLLIGALILAGTLSGS